jgi:hypothetical protein
MHTFSWVILFWVLLVIVPVLYVTNKGKSRGQDVVVRCRAGHLYTTIWIPAMSLKAVRWVNKRYQRCPVGKHWSWTERVAKSELTPEVIAEAGKFHDIRIP